MAQTLKFGNGTWATKKGSTLAFNDEDGNYKPLPFTTTRATSATRVNKEGLIEVVESDRPRIDYTDSADGVFLLEKASTNLVTYEDFTQWTDYNASAVLSEETIYGKNAYKIVEDSTINYHGVYLNNLFTANGTNYIWSVYVKGGERRYVVLTGRTGISSNDSAVIFDTQDGVWTLDVSSQNQAFSAESVGNGWWRIAIEGNPSSGAYDSYTIAASLGGFPYTNANYQGDGTSGFYVAMAQLEVGSLSSYIPTQGSAVTRVADTASGSGNSEVFNDSEGVLFVDIAALADDGTNRRIAISDGDNTDRISIGFTSSNRIQFIVQSNNSIQVNTSITIPEITENTKIAFKYKANDCAFWIDGFELGTDTIATMPSGLNVFSFDEGNGGSDFYGNTKEIGYYNTVLTDAELETLTSYRSLSELVTELNLNTL